MSFIQPSTRGERMMLGKFTLAFALAITTITMSIPALANPKPGKAGDRTSAAVTERRELPSTTTQTSSYSPGYQETADNKGGW
jgi:hypothetical protein